MSCIAIAAACCKCPCSNSASPGLQTAFHCCTRMTGMSHYICNLKDYQFALESDNRIAVKCPRVKDMAVAHGGYAASNNVARNGIPEIRARLYTRSSPCLLPCAGYGCRDQRSLLSAARWTHKPISYRVDCCLVTPIQKDCLKDSMGRCVQLASALWDRWHPECNAWV